MGGLCDTAVAAGNFKTLVAATQAAGLVETLNTKGPYTVFAPTDEAFAKLPASDVVQHKNLTTLQGQDLKVDAAKWHLHKSVKINDANIITADVKADNGVIHVIDKVLLPK
jgi:uncharacterized surface protein with fasciclin (FAS1) repeats